MSISWVPLGARRAFSQEENRKERRKENGERRKARKKERKKEKEKSYLHDGNPTEIFTI